VEKSVTEAKTYKGGCHCGEVSYEAKADLGNVIACNCSICTKRGLLLAFTPAADFTLLSGQEQITDYQFGKKKIHHLFCPTCGVESFARGSMPDGTEMVAVNIRCLEGVDIAALAPAPFDGRNL
jgi:hypothetical protein